MPSERAVILLLSHQRFTDLRHRDAEHGKRGEAVPSWHALDHYPDRGGESDFC
jgi:hypothetical protein